MIKNHISSLLKISFLQELDFDKLNMRVNWGLFILASAYKNCNIITENENGYRPLHYTSLMGYFVDSFRLDYRPGGFIDTWSDVLFPSTGEIEDISETTNINVLERGNRKFYQII